MTTYRPVAVSGRAIQGPPQQQEQSAEDDRVNGNGGVRTEWWWQAGPVDSCCCCCSLRTGVGLLAVDALLVGIWVIYFMRARAFYASVLETVLSQLQDQYAIVCGGSAATTPDCEQLKESFGRVDGIYKVILHLPTVLYVQAGFAVVAGAIGLWAVFFRSTRAAKVYMLSWPARSLLAVWGALDMRALYIKYDVDQGHVGVVYLISIFFVLYYFKVSWSYYKKRLDHEKAHTGSRSASSDTAYHSMPMFAINTNV